SINREGESGCLPLASVLLFFMTIVTSRGRSFTRVLTDTFARKATGDTSCVRGNVPSQIRRAGRLESVGLETSASPCRVPKDGETDEFANGHFPRAASAADGHRLSHARDANGRGGHPARYLAALADCRRQ